MPGPDAELVPRVSGTGPRPESDARPAGAGAGAGAPIGTATLRQVLGAGLLFAGLSVVGALVWFWWWTPAHGVVAGGEFYWRSTNIESSITGTAKYLIVASLTGFVAGMGVARRLRARPWIGLAACAVFGALAGWFLAALGHLLGPEDADAVAARSADGSQVLSDLSVEGIGAYAAMPAGALLAIAVTYLIVRPRDADL